jgi:histidinol-phosphate aminotransferase
MGRDSYASPAADLGVRGHVRALERDETEPSVRKRRHVAALQSADIGRLATFSKLESCLLPFNLLRMPSLWDRANPQLRDLAVYQPGKPIEETARELRVDPKQIIKLASNENPLGPSPKAIEAMRCALQSAQLYPDGGGFYLREALADRLGFARENIILGNGSNEVIEFLGHAFLKPDDHVITTKYAFIAYKLIAHLFGAHTVESATPQFQPDLEAALAAITPRTKIIFIANPNNPTGALISQEKIDNFISRVPENIIAVFDEAYFEFLDNPPDTLRHIRKGKNVVVLRTFSKIHGLASLRIGYGIARRELIEVLQKTRQPFNVNGIAQTGALAALEDIEHQRDTKRLIDLGRNYLQERFREMKLDFVPAAANFVMVNVGDGTAVFKKLLAEKIIVRPIKNYGLPEWLRITVGTMEQNEKCIAALKEVLQPPPAG